MEDSMKLHLYDKTKVVVVDFGFKYTKVGLGGEPNPRFILPSVIPNGTGSKAVFDTHNLDELYDNLAVFIHFIYFKRLLINPKETKVVVVESLLCPSLVRQVIAKVLFKHLHVSAALFVPSHMMALYTLAVPVALSIDIGYIETCAVPVYHSYPVLHAYQVTPIGGRAIEAEIRILLEKYYAEQDPRKVSAVRDLSDDDIEEIKVSLCFVAPLEKVTRPDKESTRPPNVHFPVPGAPALLVPGSVREDACEVLFRPDVDGVCLPTIVLDAILKCPLDMRKELAESLLLFGGTAMLRGLRKRLEAEVKLLLNSAHYKDKLHLHHLKMFSPPSKDHYTAWLGGSLLGATETVGARAITREEYNEEKDIPDWASLKYNVRKEDTCRRVFSTRIL